MYRIILFLLLSVGLFASSSMHEDHGKHDQATEVKEKKKAPNPYRGYVSKIPSKREAKAVYRCGCEDRPWKQDASKPKACPYCGPAMPKCGTLVKLLPKRGGKYSIQDYDLPNKVCPVSKEPIENKKHFLEHEGQKIFFCCKKCKRKFPKKPEKYLKKLPLKPERFGFSMPQAQVREDSKPTPEIKEQSYEHHHGPGGHSHDDI